MPEPAYAYAINAKDGGLATYPDLLDNSLKSLRPHLTDPSQVHVIYAPPHDHDHIRRLKDAGHAVHERETHDIPWPRSSHKLYLTDIEAETLIFLDADTVIYNDPADALTPGYRFAARPDPANIRYGGVDWQDWIAAFDYYDLTYLPMLTTGFCVFRDGLHRELREPWERYWRAYIDGEHPNPVKPGTDKYAEMLAFTLAVSECVDVQDVWFMGREGQAIERYGDSPDGAFVYELQRLGGRSWGEITRATEELVS